MIRIRIIGIILFCIMTLIAALYVLSKTTLITSYEEIERDQMLRNLERVDQAIQNYRNGLNIKLRDWAQWDDSYNFVQGQDDEYASINLGDPTLINLEIQYLAFENASGTIIFSKAVDLKTETVLPSENITEAIRTREFDVANESRISDIVIVDTKLYFIEGLPVLPSNGEGVPKGTIYFGRLVDPSFIAYIGKLTRLPVTLTTPTRSLGYVIEPQNENEIRGYFSLQNAHGKPLTSVQIIYDRTIYQQGQANIAAYGFISSAAILLFGCITLLLFEVLLLRRLAQLSSDVDTISVANIENTRLHDTKNDEFSKFTKTVNHLLDELSLSQKKAREAARAEMLANEKLTKTLKTTESMNKLMVGREVKMVELKERVAALERQLDSRSN